MLCHFRHQRGFGHARLRSDLEAEESRCSVETVIITEVRARHAAAAKCSVRGQCQSLDFLIDSRGNRSRQQMLRPAGRILCFVIVKLDGRHDFDDAESLLAHDRTRELLAGNIWLDKDPVPERPIATRQLLRWMSVILPYDEDAE